MGDPCARIWGSVISITNNITFFTFIKQINDGSYQWWVRRVDARSRKARNLANSFISNASLKLAKNQVNGKQYPEAELLLLKIIYILSPRYYPKITGHILKNKEKNKRVLIHEITQLIIMKMKMKMKNRSRRYDVNRHRHGEKYSNYRNYLIIRMLICIKQHLSNIWSSCLENIKIHWGWLEKKHWL